MSMVAKRFKTDDRTPNRREIIYYDYLERIFDFSDVESLLNVAGTCKRLQIVAAAKFGDEYVDKYFKLYPKDCSEFETAGYLIMRYLNMQQVSIDERSIKVHFPHFWSSWWWEFQNNWRLKPLLNWYKQINNCKDYTHCVRK